MIWWGCGLMTVALSPLPKISPSSCCKRTQTLATSRRSSRLLLDAIAFHCMCPFTHGAICATVLAVRMSCLCARALTTPAATTRPVLRAAPGRNSCDTSYHGAGWSWAVTSRVCGRNQFDADEQAPGLPDKVQPPQVCWIVVMHEVGRSGF